MWYHLSQFVIRSICTSEHQVSRDDSALMQKISTNTLALELKAWLFFPRLGIIQEDHFNYPRGHI